MINNVLLMLKEFFKPQKSRIFLATEQSSADSPHTGSSSRVIHFSNSMVKTDIKGAGFPRELILNEINMYGL